ncbi:hypothetical protein B0H14DRAFT_2612164 [Mycena olivaceomarginata]|nr:hypothetical protein B0H14DRAFT_2612164 [Mycena olivaceomarginata]
MQCRSQDMKWQGISFPSVFLSLDGLPELRRQISKVSGFGLFLGKIEGFSEEAIQLGPHMSIASIIKRARSTNVSGCGPYVTVEEWGFQQDMGSHNIAVDWTSRSTRRVSQVSDKPSTSTSTKKGSTATLAAAQKESETRVEIA